MAQMDSASADILKGWTPAGFANMPGSPLRSASTIDSRRPTRRRALHPLYCTPIGSTRWTRLDDQHRFLDQTWAATSSTASVVDVVTPFMERAGLREKRCGAQSGFFGGPMSALGSIGMPAATGLSLPVLGKVESATRSASKSADSASWWTIPTGLTNDEFNEWLWQHRTVVTAGTASLISTTSSFPFDSLKSRLQVKHYPSIWACTKAVWKEEGMSGFFRGVTIPLITISFVRTSSFAIYVNTKSWLHKNGYFADSNKLWHTAASGMAGGFTSGVIISCGSAPFELVKVMRQLEYLTAVQKGLVAQTKGKYKARSGFSAAADIARHHGGVRGFYIGFPLHFCRDSLGTALYFGSYDTFRSIVKKNSDDNVGPLGLPMPVVSFLTGSTAGIASWLLVYPVDLLKTNVQQRALSGHPRQLTGWQLFQHLLRERPPVDPTKHDTFAKRFLRLYRVWVLAHYEASSPTGLTWTLIESISHELADRTGHSVDEVMYAR